MEYRAERQFVVLFSCIALGKRLRRSPIEARVEPHVVVVPPLAHTATCSRMSADPCGLRYAPRCSRRYYRHGFSRAPALRRWVARGANRTRRRVQDDWGQELARGRFGGARRLIVCRDLSESVHAIPFCRAKRVVAGPTLRCPRQGSEERACAVAKACVAGVEPDRH